MSDQDDRLAAIKGRRQAGPAALLEEDADWLIAEVERLRGVLVELLRAYVRLYALVERVCAGTITAEALEELQALKRQPDESAAHWRDRLDPMVGQQEGDERLAVIHDLDARRSLARFFRGRR